MYLKIVEENETHLVDLDGFKGARYNKKHKTLDIYFYALESATFDDIDEKQYKKIEKRIFN